MVSVNNAINKTIGATASGVTNQLTVTNPSNTASSAARESITVGGTSAANPTINWNVVGSTDWEMGIDNSDSQKLKISQSTALGTKDVWRITKAGARTMPLQPLATTIKLTTDSNATGDGTVFTVIYPTVVIDQASNYNNATGQFTAPVTGTYFINASVIIGGLNSSHTIGQFQVALNGSELSKVFYGNVFNFAEPAGNQVLLTGSLAVSINSGDILTMQAAVSGGTKTVEVFAGRMQVFLIY